MSAFTAYCIVSGCTCEILIEFPDLDPESSEYGPIVRSAMETLLDAHERNSLDDLSIIGPVHPSGQPYEDPHAHDLDPERDIRVLSHCVLDHWPDTGIVLAGPLGPNHHWWYDLTEDLECIMVQTFALDIMALATNGRMTALRLWQFARLRVEFVIDPYDPLPGVNYGEYPSLWVAEVHAFPGYTDDDEIRELEKVQDVEIVKQRLVHEGLFWMWMAPDRFPISPTMHDYPAPVLSEVHPRGNRSAIESLPTEIVMAIVSSLPLSSLVSLAGASRSLQKEILGNDYLACIWLYNNAPWWIPVPTQTPKKDKPSESPSIAIHASAYLASGWNAQIPLTVNFRTGFDWAYIRRCMRSGSMRNRRRIWRTALEIERAADLAGV